MQFCVFLQSRKNTALMERLIENHKKLVAKIPTEFVRYLYNDINWDGKLIGLVGPRGVGKTTMVLQHIKMALPINESLYVSADHLYFSDHCLVELADAFEKHGGRYLIVDEVHKYPNWSIELKQIYDSTDLQVVFTGSSVLDIHKGMADLSRRAAVYQLDGLSFREYLILFHSIETPALSLDEILSHNYSLGFEHPLPLFEAYLKRGYYPFGRDKDFEMKIEQVVAQTMDVDIPVYANMNVSTGRKLRQLLMIIAKSVPFKPVMQKLAQMVDVSRNQIGDYLSYMDQAGMITLLRDDVGGLRGLGKVNKVYLDNTNIVYALGGQNSNIGNIRETFFLNQMRVKYDVVSSEVADFKIGACTFEVGGRNKQQKQIRDVDNAYVVKDDIEFGGLNIIPLWAFGLTY